MSLDWLIDSKSVRLFSSLRLDFGAILSVLKKDRLYKISVYLRLNLGGAESYSGP
jgi:hypothetical protein